METTKRLLTAGDVRAERGRAVPIVSQEALAKELGWNTPAVIDIEVGKVQVTQEQLQAMLDAITRIVARREEMTK